MTDAYMIEPNTLRVAFHERRAADVWRKSATEWEIVERGRYGPAWMSRLVLWAARKLGMLRHARSVVGTTVKTVQIDTPDCRDLYGAMFQAVETACHLHGWAQSEVEVVCGQLDYAPLADMPLHGSVTFSPVGAYRVDWENNVRTRIAVDVPVRVVPGLRGWAVLPLRR